MATTENDPFSRRNVKHPTNDIETFIHLVKGSLGAGVLAMPYAFKHIGLWTGIGATILVCFICSYCIHMLVTCAQTLCYRHNIPKLSYAETAETVFLDKDGNKTYWSKFTRNAVNFLIVLDLLGCVCIYLVNVGRNIEQVINLHSPELKIQLSIWIMIIACPLMALCLIRNLKYLAPFSLVANIFVFLSLIITCTFIFVGLPDPSERDAVAKISRWPTFFATSIFALECVAVVLPLENEMKNPKHFTGCPSVLLFAMTIVGILYTFLGFFGYFKYGEASEANISLNLPVENLWCQAVKLMVSAAIYLSILLTFYVPINIVESAFQSKVPEGKTNLYQNMLRIALIITCTLIAAVFPNLGPFLSLIGAVCLSFLGLILPAIFDMVVFRTNPGYGWMKYRLVKDILLIIFGLVGFATGTVESIIDFQR